MRPLDEYMFIGRSRGAATNGVSVAGPGMAMPRVAVPACGCAQAPNPQASKGSLTLQDYPNSAPENLQVEQR